MKMFYDYNGVELCPIWIDKDGSKWEEHADGRLSYNGGLPKTVAEVASTWGPLTPPVRDAGTKVEEMTSVTDDAWKQRAKKAAKKAAKEYCESNASFPAYESDAFMAGAAWQAKQDASTIADLRASLDNVTKVAFGDKPEERQVEGGGDPRAGRF